MAHCRPCLGCGPALMRQRLQHDRYPVLVEQRRRRPSEGWPGTWRLGARIRRTEVMVQRQVEFVKAVLCRQAHISLSAPNLRRGIAVSECLVPADEICPRRWPGLYCQPRSRGSADLQQNCCRVCRHKALAPLDPPGNRSIVIRQINLVPGPAGRKSDEFLPRSDSEQRGITCVRSCKD